MTHPLLALVALAALSPTYGTNQGDEGSLPPSFLGPFIGATDATSTRIWARAAAPGTYRLSVGLPGEDPLPSIEVEASATSHFALTWTVAGLMAATEYAYSIEGPDGETLASGEPFRFRTSPPEHDDASVRLMFASCAREDDATAATWRAVAAAEPDAVVLLGDTPYIDRTDLEFQRTRYGQFAAFAPMAELLAHTPWYATWDDHDFGRNDTDGRIQARGHARQAFIEHHALTSYGDGERGIYTSFRSGPVEVFLLDTRSFAAMEPSPFRAHSASLLGARQWSWLQERLEESTAPVKVLACGMIWNGSVRPGKLDHWGSYPHERDALFRFIGDEKISGVVLVGGDIHRSRVVLHDVEAAAGYPIHELIVSPMHSSIIESANQPHPGLIRDMGTPQTFLLLEASQAGGELKSLAAVFRDASGVEHFSIDLRRGR